MEKSHRAHQNAANKPSTSRRATAPSASPNNAMLHWQRSIGNQAVQRHLNALPGVPSKSDLQRRGDSAVRPASTPTISIAGKPALLQRAGESDDLDSRIEPKSVPEVSDCKIAKRKVEYTEKKKTAVTGYGATNSKLTIEYSVDNTGKVTLGCLKPEFTVTIFSPYITSDQFVEKFTPLMQRYWDQYEGNMQAFSEDRDVRNFNYYDQTLRHEEKHVNARNLALIDILPEYKTFLKENDGYSSESSFLRLTEMYWAVAWNEKTEQKISHERIHSLDAQEMVEEYQRRAGSEKPEPKQSKTVWDQVTDFAYNFFFSSEQ